MHWSVFPLKSVISVVFLQNYTKMYISENYTSYAILEECGNQNKKVLENAEMECGLIISCTS